jgi:UDP-2,3-diacylglucosamine pyrophosphatase LpxH
MKKIKLIVSDLHLSAGPRMADGTRNVLEDFFLDDYLVEFIEHYGGRGYSDYEVELIANGDFFNMLQVQVDEKEPPEAITEEVAAEQMRRIIDGHPAVIEALWTFGVRPNNHFTFVIGNHDAGLLFPAVQALLRKRLGPGIRFVNDYAFDGVFVSHGHQYEFIHNFDMHNFTHLGPDGKPRLVLTWGALFIMKFLNVMKKRRDYIDKVNPFGRYLRWTFWNDPLFFWRLIVGIVHFWAVNRFSRDPYRRREFRLSPSRLAAAMTHKTLAETAADILAHTSYRLVIFGHSHKLDYRHFAPNGEYINTGSWMKHISLEMNNLGVSQLRPFVLIQYVDGQPRATLRDWYGSPRLHREIIT